MISEIFHDAFVQWDCTIFKSTFFQDFPDVQISIFAPPCPLLALFLNYDKRCFSQLKLHVEVDITSFYTFNAPKTVKTVKIKTKSRVYYFFFAVWASSVNMLNSSWKIQEQSFLSSATKTSIAKRAMFSANSLIYFCLGGRPLFKISSSPPPLPLPPTLILITLIHL